MLRIRPIELFSTGNHIFVADGIEALKFIANAFVKIGAVSHPDM